MRDPPSEPVALPDAEPFVGPFRLERQSYSLSGGSTLVFVSDGRYHGRFEGPGAVDDTEGRLDDAGRGRLRVLVGALVALPRDEYEDPEIRDGLRVTYRLISPDRPERIVTCRNRFPPAARGIEQLVRERISRAW